MGNRGCGYCLGIKADTMAASTTSLKASLTALAVCSPLEASWTRMRLPSRSGPCHSLNPKFGQIDPQFDQIRGQYERFPPLVRYKIYLSNERRALYFTRVLVTGCKPPQLLRYRVYQTTVSGRPDLKPELYGIRI